MVRLITLCLLMAGGLLGSTAHAQPDTTAETEARERFARGVELFDAGSVELALPEFEAAYHLAPTYELLYNIGVTASRARRHARALRALAQYLEEGGDRIEAARRAEVEAELTRLRSLVGRLRLEVLPDGTHVRLDGSTLGQSPFNRPVVVSAGRHELELSAIGYETQRRVVTVQPTQTTVMVIDLTLLDAAHRAVPLSLVPEPPAKGRTARVIGWATLGTGLGAGAVSLVFGGLAIKANNRLSDQLSTYPADLAKVSGARDDLSRYSLAADGFGIGALALVTTGAIFLLVDKLSDGESD